jgi:predicted secreted protein
LEKALKSPNRQLAALAAAVALTALPATAQVLPPPQNVLALNASATVEVTKDWLSITLGTNAEGNDAAAAQAQLKQALDAALNEARRAAKPGQIEVRTGAFSLYPRYNPKGGIAGWQGRAELVIEGRDITGISQLAGRMQTLAVARVLFSLSREAREKVEAEVAAQAIARFRAAAEAYAKQFGFAGYTIREVQIGTSSDFPTPVPMLRAQAAPQLSEAAVPVEAGKGAVTVNVNGSIQMQVK